MAQAKVILEKDYVIGDVHPNLFGGFIEHLGRHIYTGIHEPGHPTADARGFRGDVMQLIKQLNMPVMRYPGGNFVSGYNWEDGVGPRERRPVRLDPAWATTETNQFGTNEFIDWAREAGTAPMLAVNLGTRGADEARAYLEYCNHPGGTYWSDLRKSHGYAEPHGVKYWCLGNEMDGPWQMGHKTATEYGRLACETAKLMKWIDPSVELVVCGSSFRGISSYGAWELEVLEHAFDHVDYLSLHNYYSKPNNDLPGFLGWADHMDRFIEECITFADAAAAKRRSFKRIMLSFDEYNIMTNTPRTQAARWQQAPVHHEDIYSFEDTLAFGGLLLALLNHADRVKIGCLAQVVNVIAPIMTVANGPAWRQGIFHPFAQVSQWGRGTVLRALVSGSVYDASNGQGFPHLKMSAVLQPKTGGITLFALNRSIDAPLDLTVDLRSFGNLRVAAWDAIHGLPFDTTNGPDCEPIRPAPLTGATLSRQQLRAQLPAASWNVIRLEEAR